MTWIQTHHARAFDLLEPRAEDVIAADVAYALSRVNRFSGHTHGEPYSVAHHSMLVADLLASWGAPPAIVREGLLHDAGEAYYGDLTSPVAAAISFLFDSAANDAVRKSDDEVRCALLARSPLRALRERIDRVVRAALVLPEHEHPLVKRADLVALAIERRDLFGGVTEPRDWALPEFAPPSAPCGRLWSKYGVLPCARERIGAADLCAWDVARVRFLALLSELDAQIVSAS